MSITKSIAERLAVNIDFDEEQQRTPEITNPNVLAVARLLVDNPLLVVPTLRWVQTKIAEMAGAQLSVLYTPEELDEMRKNV